MGLAVLLGLRSGSGDLPETSASPAPVASDAAAAPGERVAVVLRDGRRVPAWLVAYDGAAGELRCVERATGETRTFAREDVVVIEHE